ncbi:sensor histidine kinase [Salirhabdus sp. Marseille-P4669]|uniref:sensor histidine kinase n=1 Tax=Salirhabdus sp. Marseille-P4669 TaxID=2042310 RepID=UPI000C7AB60E|nr:sensor histidine kinase [Salirhabdus sp. Marseille-P4669]
MKNWYQIIPKSTVLSIYVWIIFCILPFYFIFRSSSTSALIYGICMVLVFFISYRLSFLSKGWTLYLWIAIQMGISIAMTLLIGYVYFALFLAFFIGNIQSKAAFISLYVVHLTSTIAAISTVVFIHPELILSQFPFVIVCVIGVILLPFTMYNRMKREILEGQLESANKRISRLMIVEERQRIARDLHDTLGHKLSLIGLKSDLAGKLLEKSPNLAKKEIQDIHQTARTALKEVRELVSDMRGVKLKEEILHIQQILEAAEMDYTIEGDPVLTDTTLLVENVLSMCLKESVTNVIKHSQATKCHIFITESSNEVLLKVKDNGVGFKAQSEIVGGHGLEGMKERLEFVNGHIEIISNNGTTIVLRVPKVAGTN